MPGDYFTILNAHVPVVGTHRFVLLVVQLFSDFKINIYVIRRLRANENAEHLLSGPQLNGFQDRWRRKIHGKERVTHVRDKRAELRAIKKRILNGEKKRCS